MKIANTQMVKFCIVCFLMLFLNQLKASGLNDVELTKRVYVNELDLIDLRPCEAIEKLVGLAYISNLKGQRETYFRYEGMKIEDEENPPELSIGVAVFGEKVKDEKLGVVLRDVSLWQAFEYIASKIGNDYQVVVLGENAIALMPKDLIGKYIKSKLPNMKGAVESKIFLGSTIIPKRFNHNKMSQGDLAEVFNESSQDTIKLMRRLKNGGFFNIDHHDPNLAEDAEKITVMSISFNEKIDVVDFSAYGIFTYNQLLKLLHLAWKVSYKVNTQGGRIMVEVIH